jgi:hypothetical protein
MDATVFTTEKIARIIGVPEWRVVRFAQDRGFGITPAFGDAAGPGSRRLYNVENVCEMALASWLIQAGLRVEVIGRVLKQIRKQGGLTGHLNAELRREALDTYLAIIRKPKGKITGQEAVYIRDWERLGNILKQEWESSALVIDIGRRFQLLKHSAAWD